MASTTFTSNAPIINDRQSISFLSSVAILWLIIPYIIFVIGFYKWYLMLPTLLLLACFAKPIISNFSQPFNIPKSCLLTALLASVGFVWFSGLIPPLGLARDWEKHFAIMRFMVSDAWPPVVATDHGDYFLRYNMALYLLPTLLDNIAYIGLRYWVAMYEIIGLCIFFLLLMFITQSISDNNKPQPLKTIVACIIFMGFSGLDILGSFYGGNNLDFRIDIEWWASLVSFSSTKTQLDFMPQHCLPAWIGVSLLYLNARVSGAILKEGLFLLLALLFFWSPLVFVGTLLLSSLYIKDSFLLIKKPFNVIIFLLTMVVIMLPLAMYFNVGSDSIAKWALIDFRSPNIAAVKGISLFLLLEVLVYLVIAFNFFKESFHRKLLANMLVVFIVASLFHVGVEYNDFSLKVSMPVLGLLALFVTVIFIKGDFQQTPKRVLGVILISTYLVGLITPINRIVKSVNTMHIEYTADINEALQNNAAQYIASVKDKPFFLKDTPPTQ